MNRRSKLDSTCVAVDPPPLRILQDFEVRALVLPSKLIGREQADRETRDVENIVCYDGVTTSGQEANRRQSFREDYHPVSQPNRTPVRFEGEERRPPTADQSSNWRRLNRGRGTSDEGCSYPG